jgi:phosphoribosylamine--glycine ligase
MKVLILGSGGREHALAWKLAQSPLVKELLIGPGNPGTERLGRNVVVKADDPAAVVSLAQLLQIDLVVVGPEAPLVAGVADALEKAKVPVFGPVAAAARLEGSKAFAKEIMAEARVPTASFEVFEGNPAAAEAYARKVGPLVVKADGLAAGKGVVVASSGEEAAAAVRELSALGAAGHRLVLEEKLEGEEISMIALCDGERWALLPPAQDHKRIGDGDTGPNTGGMGAYTPAPFLTGAALEETGRAVIGPTLKALARRGTPFRGALYAGLMMTRSGPKVLEYNARFGDPETQVLMMQVEGDLLPWLLGCARGELPAGPLRARPGASVGVVMAAHNYPGTPRAGDPIEGLAQDFGDDAEVFHAGTRRDGLDRVVTVGGRVLTACAWGPSLPEAKQRAYEVARKISFAGAQLRSDIGARGVGFRP